MASGSTHDEAESTSDVDSRRTILPDARETGAEAVDPYLHKVIADRYEIESYVGHGSMGTVYRCRHRVLGNYFAVKIIRQELLRETEAVSRFFTEAKAASAIGSKHIVEVIDFGELPNGAAYILMEYLQGRTLYEELGRSSKIPAPRAIEIGIQLASALGAAHAASIVHRDLKPDNVFLVDAQNKDFVKVLDFGIAKVLRESSKLTQAGTVIGTPAYMSPEQALGRETDQRTDIYALGIMLYEMACGEVPFSADNPLAVLSMHVSEPPRSLSERLAPGELPDGYEAVIAKCLAKHPSDRFQSMEEVAAALGAVASGIVPEVTPPQRQSVRPSIITPHLAFGVPAELADDENPFAPKRRPALKRVAAGVGLGGALALGLLLASRSPAPAPAPVVVAAPTPPAPAPAPTIASAPATPELKEVHLVLYPIDARAHDGEKDLGEMPITLKLAPGEKKTLTISRRGFVSRRVTIDDSEARVVVGLVVDKQAERDADPTAKRERTFPRRPVIADNPFDDNPY